jgi:uncharacterized repeat protein (TIGR03803 family)
MLPQGKNENLARFAAIPETLHVDPLFDFPGGRGGAQGLSGSGGVGGLIGDPKTALYGVAPFGGDLNYCSGFGCGTVFDLTPVAGITTYRQTVLYRFNGSDGATPLAALVRDDAGSLYGTTYESGRHRVGSAFKLTPSGAKYHFSVIYSFDSKMGGQPRGPLLLGQNGTLYGTASDGGAYQGCGAVFELTPAGSHYKETIIHSFEGMPDGCSPITSLTVDAAGAMYGTTYYGGTYGMGSYCGGGCGTVFKLTPSSSGYTERVIYAFTGDTDGGNPEAGVTISSNGTLYGTTPTGGEGAGCGDAGCGTVYKLAPHGSAYREVVIYHFSLGEDGISPETPLASGKDGMLYGTTNLGGDQACGVPHFRHTGCGVIYKVDPSSSQFRVLKRLSGGDIGKQPDAPLFYARGSLYGETVVGGRKGFGTVFKLSP